ncbi:hypothetical protein HaLaN_29662, partial [Haematococcus lacustris]
MMGVTRGLTLPLALSLILFCVVRPLFRLSAAYITASGPTAYYIPAHLDSLLAPQRTQQDVARAHQQLIGGAAHCCNRAACGRAVLPPRLP